MDSILRDDNEGKESLLRAERRNSTGTEEQAEQEISEMIRIYKSRKDLREKINLCLDFLLENEGTEETRDASLVKVV